MGYLGTRQAILVKYYKFNSYRTIWSLYRKTELRKKTDRVINTGRSKMLDSGFFENETWGALHKAWKGYVIAKNKDENDKLERYARIIQELQDDLGLRVSSFPNAGIPAFKFYAIEASKILKANKARNNSYSHSSNNNNNDISEEQIEEEHLTDNGGQVNEEEILSDENVDNEYFKDDFNKGDRFTS